MERDDDVTEKHTVLMSNDMNAMGTCMESTESDGNVKAKCKESTEDLIDLTEKCKESTGNLIDLTEKCMKSMEMTVVSLASTKCSTGV